MSGFSRMATVTASTKRKPSVSGGIVGTATTNVASLSCTPLDPLDAETQRRLGIDTPMELLQTFVDAGVDIVEGDILVVSSTEYPVRAVADWTWRGSTYRHLIVEDLKR